MIELIKTPGFWLAVKVLLVYWLFSAAVGSLDTPTEKSSSYYVFLFRFLHRLAGNLNRAAVALKVPGVEAEPNHVPPS